MSAASDDLTPLLVPEPVPTLRYGQAEILSWDPSTLSSRIRFRGVVLEDVPVLSGVSALGYQAGDQIILLGWDAGGGKGATHWWVLGRLALPGQDSPDVIIRGSVLAVEDDDSNRRVEVGLGPSGGGQFATLHPNGTPHFLIGEIEAGGVPVGQGLLVQRDDGSDLPSAFADAVTGNQEVRIWDHNENLVFTTDKNGVGLDRPYLDVPLWPVNSFGTAQWTGADWQSIWLGRFYATHPALHVQARTWTTDDTTPTTGDVRVLVDGVQLGSIENIGNATEIVDFGSDTLVHGLGNYVFAPIEIQSRVTAGDGYISVMPYGVTKKGTV